MINMYTYTYSVGRASWVASRRTAHNKLAISVYILRDGARARKARTYSMAAHTQSTQRTGTTALYVSSSRGRDRLLLIARVWRGFVIVRIFTDWLIGQPVVNNIIRVIVIDVFFRMLCCRFSYTQNAKTHARRGVAGRSTTRTHTHAEGLGLTRLLL